MTQSLEELRAEVEKLKECVRDLADAADMILGWANEKWAKNFYGQIHAASQEALIKHAKTIQECGEPAIKSALGE